MILETFLTILYKSIWNSSFTWN